MRAEYRAISGWASEGLKEKEIIKKLKLKNIEKDLVKKAMEFNKEMTDGELIASGIAIATGYYIYEDEAFKVKSYEEFDGKLMPVERVEVVSVKKHIPANGSMAQFMLKHRVPRYRDEKEIDDKISVKFDFDEAIEEYSK